MITALLAISMRFQFISDLNQPEYLFLNHSRRKGIARRYSRVQKNGEGKKNKIFCLAANYSLSSFFRIIPFIYPFFALFRAFHADQRGCLWRGVRGRRGMPNALERRRHRSEETEHTTVTRILRARQTNTTRACSSE